MLRIYDLWGLLKACWIVSFKHRGFIPEILPVCRCVVSDQQQRFAKLQSEMKQLARPPACQPSHPAKTNDRGPLLLLHNSSYTSSFYITSHKYTQDKSQGGGGATSSLFLSLNKKTNSHQGLNPNSASLQYLNLCLGELTGAAGSRFRTWNRPCESALSLK